MKFLAPVAAGADFRGWPVGGYPPCPVYPLEIQSGGPERSFQKRLAPRIGPGRMSSIQVGSRKKDVL